MFGVCNFTYNQEKICESILFDILTLVTLDNNCHKGFARPEVKMFC